MKMEIVLTGKLVSSLSQPNVSAEASPDLSGRVQKDITLTVEWSQTGASTNQGKLVTDLAQWLVHERSGTSSTIAASFGNDARRRTSAVASRSPTSNSRNFDLVCISCQYRIY